MRLDSYLVPLSIFLLTGVIVSAVPMSPSKTSNSTSPKSPVLFYDGHTLAEIYFVNRTIERCKLREVEKKSEAEAVSAESNIPLTNAAFSTMLYLINQCSHLLSATEEPPTMSSTSKWSLRSLWSGIVPGTKWCGLGDAADTYEELGSSAQSDTCCRAHDHCPVKLKSFRYGYGMINFSFYTKSHCDCDRQFHTCLKQANSRMADILGNFYFNIMKVQCLKEETPIVCLKTRVDTKGKDECVQWIYDTEQSTFKMVDAELRY